MGHPDSLCYLASPAVVAASAVAGHIASPAVGDVATQAPAASIVVNKKASGGTGGTELLKGFPETITGNVVFCHQVCSRGL